MSLAEDMSEWGTLKEKLDALEAKIIDEVRSLGKTQVVGRVTASYSKGKGSYDYHGIAQELTYTQQVELAHCKTVYDWKSIAEDSGMTDEIKEKFYIPPSGLPTVSVKLK